MSGVPPSSATVRRTASAMSSMAAGSSSGSRSRSARVRNGSATTGPLPGTMSRSTPTAWRGTTMSLKKMAASTPCRRTGWRVISATRSGVRHACSIGTPCLTSRYSGSERPAWRMNHTGVNGTGCCRAARTRGLSAGEPGAASEGAGPAVEGVTARSSHVPGGAPLPGVSEDTLRLGSVVSRIQGGRGGVAGPGIPDAFARAVDGVRSAVLRPEVVVEEVPAPTRLAPSALALSGEVYPTRSLDEEPTATGRFVLLHDPSAPEPWEGVWRVVTYAKAAMEPELGHDPMLGQVGWSWLTEALESHGLAFAAEAGAVTCVL